MASGSGPPPAGAYGYNVRTTYQPNMAGDDEVVPAVPHHMQQPAGAWGGQAPPPAWGAQPPQMQAQQGAQLQFTDSTAPQYVAGNMSRQEERAGLVQGTVRSDNPNPSSSNAAPGAVPKEDYSKYPFYNVRRYRNWFDVDTMDVLWRVGNSLIGLFRPNFIEVTMASPDLYGPFWVATTLVLLTAITGNFADYISWRKKATVFPPPPPALPVNGTAPAATPAPAHTVMDDQWFTDYTKLSASAGIFYGYIFVIGLILFFLVKWFKGELRLINVLCVYGYAMTIFIPVSMACIIPVNWLRWLLVMVATALSGGFLLRNFKRAIFAAAPARAILIMILVFVLHLGLGLALKLYFFSY